MTFYNGVDIEDEHNDRDFEKGRDWNKFGMLDALSNRDTVWK